MRKRECGYCGVEFDVPPRYPWQRFCSANCYDYWRKHGRKSRLEHLALLPESKTCEYCGLNFAFSGHIGSWKIKRFCSLVCQKRARSLRRSKVFYEECRIGGGYRAYLALKFELIWIEKWPCVECGQSDPLLLEVDHIVPRFVGGTNDRANLQVLCIRHHRIKTAKDLVGFQSNHSLIPIMG